MKTRSSWKRLSIGCLMLALLTGCATGTPETPTPEPTEFPTGRFINEDGIRAFEFDEDGTWHYFERNMEVPLVSGKYAANGNLYTEMTHDYLSERSIPVTYFWAYDGKNLTFELYGEDVLSHRKTCYDGETYTKSE